MNYVDLSVSFLKKETNLILRACARFLVAFSFCGVVHFFFVLLKEMRATCNRRRCRMVDGCHCGVNFSAVASSDVELFLVLLFYDVWQDQQLAE